MKRILAALLAASANACAQCVMCQRTAAAQAQARAEVLNTGILVLAIPPVLILAGILARACRRRDR